MKLQVVAFFIGFVLGAACGSLVICCYHANSCRIYEAEINRLKNKYN